MTREHRRADVEIEDDTDRAQTTGGRQQTPREKADSVDRFMERLTGDESSTE